MEIKVGDESTKDEIVLTKKQFAAIVNTIARHDKELNDIHGILAGMRYLVTQDAKWRKGY